MDLQLYQTACLVQSNDPLRWTNVILHPGMMHTLMKFLDYVGTLMKASGVDVLISAAFAGITSIVNRKAWTNALRAYRLIIAMLLHNFYSNGAKTYEELNVYLETARGHPTGRLRVDCFVKTHCCRSCSCAESGTVTSSSSSTVQGNAAILLRSINYAHYLSWYVRQMEHLPQRAKEDPLVGAHVCRHLDGGPQCQQISSESRHISSEGMVLEV